MALVHLIALNVVVAAPPPKAVQAEEVLFVARRNVGQPDRVLEVLDSTGTSRGHLALGRIYIVVQARVSPDGKRLAFVSMPPQRSNGRGDYADPHTVYVVDLPLTGVPTEPTIKEVLDPSIAWAADGRSLFISGCPPDADLNVRRLFNKKIPRRTVRYDVATKTEKSVEVPPFHAVVDASPDGKTVLTRTLTWGSPPAYSTYLVSLDSREPKLVGKEEDGFVSARFSPDGSRVLGTRTKGTKSTDLGLFVYDVSKKTSTKVPLPDEIGGTLQNGCAVWSPDGKRVALLGGEEDGALPGLAPAARPAGSGHRQSGSRWSTPTVPTGRRSANSSPTNPRTS
jgi:Tol biopolymer transport system component